MPEPSDINSHESKHRLANIRLTEMEDTNHTIIIFVTIIQSTSTQKNTHS